MTCARCAEPAKWRVVLVNQDWRRTERYACDRHEREIYETGLAAPWCRSGWRDPIAQPKSSTEASVTNARRCDAVGCERRAVYTLTVLYSGSRVLRDYCPEHEQEYYAAALRSRFVDSAWREPIHGSGPSAAA